MDNKQKRTKHDEAITFGNKIRKARIKNHLSMEKVGERLTPPASKGAVSNWENGYNLPTPTRTSQLQDILGASLNLNDMELNEDQSIVRDYLCSQHKNEGILELASLWEASFEYSMGAYLPDDLANVVEALASLDEKEQYEVVIDWAEKQLEV